MAGPAALYGGRGGRASCILGPGRYGERAALAHGGLPRWEGGIQLAQGGSHTQVRHRHEGGIGGIGGILRRLSLAHWYWLSVSWHTYPAGKAGMVRRHLVGSPGLHTALNVLTQLWLSPSYPTPPDSGRRQQGCALLAAGPGPRGGSGSDARGHKYSGICLQIGECCPQASGA